VSKTTERYRILRKLGEGGMGVVYAAHDERLDRPVAIKRMHGRFGDGLDEQRLWREARAGASVNHPNVCQIYEIVEDGHELILAMELLEGEPLSARLARGALSPGEAGQIGLAVLSALGALHHKGIVHRDLKPSNIFLSQHGVKLLDFGLARPLVGIEASAGGPLTLPGVLVGTPAYMAPEQIEGVDVDARSDLFVLGVVLYEMLSGRLPFAGHSVFEVARAITHDEPPALAGSPVVIAIDQVIHRAVHKRPEERYQTAAAFAQDLRSALLITDSTEAPAAHPLTRLVVLPFRLLRPDSEMDFLAFSLADAISSALSGLPALVVRSTMAASPFVGAAPDIRALATTLDVDVVLVGTLLHSASQVRVNAQLVQAPSGTLMRAITAQAAADDIFQLQDQLTKSIVESLSLSLMREQAPASRDAPSSAEAYECYLRGNQIFFDSKQWVPARDLYLRSVNLDPKFAPAWARLGRCYRVLAKFGDPSTAPANMALAEDALKRALTLSPDLALAHHLYTHVEVEAGRPRQAMVRLLERARLHPSEPELFAGLVHACRYCGLLEASEAAWERARRLDPSVVTSVGQTFLIKGDWERAIALEAGDPPLAKAIALVQSGRVSEGVGLLQAALERGGFHRTIHDEITGVLAVLQGRQDDIVVAVQRILGSGFRDPEGFYHWAGALAQAGDHDGALMMLERSVEGGFYAASALARDPWFDPLRAMSDFTHIVRRAEEFQREALAAFRAADGPRVLGVPQL
jgi:serine/threonine protein kinase